jgi:Asp-tRNA(Asn)/Glu-tRNA(Gln) amidotransferase B subunit
MSGLTRGRTGLWEVCVGLEVHVQLRARTKLFSGAAGPSGASVAPNACVSPFDAAHPGALPRLGVGAVSAALRAALTLRASVPRLSAFERKHYAYADLPHGFQVTQLRAPFAVGGVLPFAGGVARVERLQLEMDSGRLLVGDGPGDGAGAAAAAGTRLDLNRAGAALLEVVFAPDVRSPADAAAVVRALQSSLRDVGASDAAMEAGGLRADVNVSVRRAGARAAADFGGASGSPRGAALTGDDDDVEGALDGEYVYGDLAALAGAVHVAVGHAGGGRGWAWVFKDAHRAARAIARGKGGAADDAASARLDRLSSSLTPTALGFGQRVEYKNLNSFRSIAGAVAAESMRQVALLEAAAEGAAGVDSETRAFDAATGETRRLRGKEAAPDYRFIDEPDVVPLLIPTRVMLAALAAQPASPASRAAALAAATGIPGSAAAALVAAGDTCYFLDALGSALSSAAPARPAPREWDEHTAPRALPTPLTDEASRATARTLSNWVTNEVAGALREGALREHHPAGGVEGDERALRARLLPPSALGELVALIVRGGVSATLGKGVLRAMLRHGCGATQAAALAGLPLGSATAATPPPSDADVDALARAAIALPALSGAVAKYASGRGAHALGPLIAHVCAAMGGAHADAARAGRALTALLGPPQHAAVAHEGRKARAKRLAEEALMDAGEGRGDGLK